MNSSEKVLHEYIQDTAKESAMLEFMDYVLEKNEHVNLTSIKDRDEFIIKHLVDSVLVGKLNMEINGKYVLDIGTGAGFPGIPLAITYPDARFLLMDSLNKRIKIINEFIQSKDMTNVTAMHGRAEQMGKDPIHREKFDIVVSRAVANLNLLLEYSVPFLKVGGVFIAYKGPNYEQELDGLENALKVLKCEIINKIELTLPYSLGTRNFIIIKKKAQTDKKYPRETNLIQKKPL